MRHHSYSILGAILGYTWTQYRTSGPRASISSCIGKAGCRSYIPVFQTIAHGFLKGSRCSCVYPIILLSDHPATNGRNIDIANSSPPDKIAQLQPSITRSLCATLWTNFRSSRLDPVSKSSMTLTRCVGVMDKPRAYGTLLKPTSCLYPLACKKCRPSLLLLRSLGFISYCPNVP